MHTVDNNEFTDRGLQLCHVSGHAPSNPAVGDLGKPRLHRVDPRRGGERKVEMGTVAAQLTGPAAGF